MTSIFGNIDDLYLFCSVVEEGSLQAAARQLKLPVSTMSRRLSALESRLNIKLLEKQGRELVATQTGQDAFVALQSGMEAIEIGMQQLVSNQSEVTGKIKMALPHNFYRGFVGEVIAEFLQQYPKVTLDLVLSQEQVLPQTDRDLLMTFDIDGLEDMVARPLFEAQHGFYTSPEYLARHGDKVNHLKTLASLDWVSVDHMTEIPVYEGDQLIEVMDIHPKLVVNDIMAVLSAAEKGLGVASLPIRYVTPEMNLVSVLPQYHRNGRQAYLVYKPRRYQPKALTLLIETLLDKVKPFRGE